MELAGLVASAQGDGVGRNSKPPDGMVYVPGGVTQIGAEDGAADERPVFAATVRPFFMDVHPVTVAEFRKFVEITRYATDAETALFHVGFRCAKNVPAS